MTTNTAAKTQEIMDIVADMAISYMRKGHSFVEAQTAAAEWLYNTYPTLAAAITLEGSK